ncbi:uncharacterized protein LOC103309399 [Acyrthosiphon pisum]|uniref:Uncharacterized protein n=1 Tax=Acyrthosiphon pisum TaxID=7029 RepID=A0A8R2F8J8_ACYPI|nr:uncharacterized protein LOC103309399 [Acyrthosiphon pisum]|eukprot:XP_008182942.1 PREDICTED: uncharacterized protein LOC103309399 [Acyrthosiphon pisum]
MERKMSVAEMMFRWMSGVTREDRIINEYLFKRYRIGVASIVDKMRENRLRWLGLVSRREITEAVSMTKNKSVDRKRRRGKPKKRWFEVIECDMRMTAVCKDHSKWKLRTRVADPK